MGVEYEAVTRLSERLQRVQKKAPVIVDVWLHKMVGPALVAEMRERAPKDTGYLASQIRAINEPGRVRVAPFGVEYNQYLVKGTRPHELNAKGQAMSFMVNGTRVFARKVHHPGTRPNPYMEDSAKAVTKRLIPRLSQLMIDVMETGEANAK